MAKRLMIQGTMSSAGKSLIAAGFCRLFKQDGHRVAPFKSQNMASASHICADGGEISVAQAYQAEAAGQEATVFMNPILLKPSSEMGSKVYVLGQYIKEMQATDYFAYRKPLRTLIVDIFRGLAQANDIVVLEGAGSPAEINLNENDIVNMGMAKIANAPVILVADIDRGGVFAAIYGTVMLLPKEERARIKGVIINKFRGDLTLLEGGLRMIEEKTNIPVLGVIPYLQLSYDTKEEREAAYETVAESLRTYVDIEKVYRMMEEHPDE